MSTAQAKSKRKPRKPPAGKHNNAYPVPRKAEALAYLQANNGNVLKTATQFGVNESTLRYWVEQAARDDEYGRRVRDLRDEKCNQLIPLTEDVCWAAARQVLDKLPDSSARDAAVTFGIFNQHNMSLRGAPTQRIEVTHRHPVLAQMSDAQWDAAQAILAQLAGPVVDALPLPAGETVQGDTQCAGGAQE